MTTERALSMSSPGHASGPDVTHGRWPSIDGARGGALAAMVVYHFAWDLSSLRLISIDVVESPAWHRFAQAIAASFLLLVGIGLVLGHGAGVRWRAFLTRLAVVTAAALIITIGTWFAFPDSYIFFGVLHCIAVSSIFALPFLRAPVILVLAAAILCFAARSLVSLPALDAPHFYWLGLNAYTPSTNDYVPVLPWFGFVLLGIATARLGLPLAAGVRGWKWRDPVSKGLKWSGRHSLVIYLVHQPILLGGLLLLVQVTGPNPAAEEAFFVRDCESTCAETGAKRTVCTAGCGCAVQRLKAEGLWREALAANPSAEEQQRVSAVSGQCFKPASHPTEAR
jgi:uncharacterized membrane protein